MTSNFSRKKQSSRKIAEDRKTSVLSVFSAINKTAHTYAREGVFPERMVAWVALQRHSGPEATLAQIVSVALAAAVAEANEILLLTAVALARVRNSLRSAQFSQHEQPREVGHGGCLARLAQHRLHELRQVDTVSLHSESNR